MKAAYLTQYGSTEAITLNENASEPAVSPGKVVVRVHAAGLNPFDWKVRSGAFQETIPLPLPVILGGDFSGVVTAVGEGVSEYHVGDEVYGSANIFNGGTGALAEYDLADVSRIMLKPAHLTHIEAAALPSVSVSAWQALFEHMHLAPGQKVLIHGAAGGIGHMAVQLAKHAGVHVTATSGTRNIEYVKELGADRVIDYQQESFADLPPDFDAVFDTVGGETYKNSFRVLKKNGILVSMVENPDNISAEQYGVTAVQVSTDVNHERLSKISELVGQGIIDIEIDRTFPLDQAGEALTYLQTGHPRGKVVVVMGEAG